MTVVEWPSKRVKLKQLKPYERNPRSISKEAYAALKDKIERLGFNSPIVATHDLRIVSGHQRLKILQELGVKDIEVKYAPYEMTDDQFKEALIEANVSDGQWDLEMLRIDYQPQQLKMFGLDLKLLDKAPKSGLTDEDAVPELDSTAVTRMGDTWILGNHRLHCGDATKASDVLALLGSAKPHLMVTDPPYGVEYDADKARKGSSAKGKVLNDDRADWGEAWALFPGNIAYLWHADRHCGEVWDSLVANGFKVRSQIIWSKSSAVFSRGDYHSQHEPCFYAVKGKGNWTGDRKQTTVWNIPKPQKSETGHSTQKPVECMKRPIENNSLPGDSVYEPFSGSGTTIIAGEITQRNVFAMELSTQYVDMAVRRWMAFTGKEAILEESAETFSELSKQKLELIA